MSVLKEKRGREKNLKPALRAEGFSMPVEQPSDPLFVDERRAAELIGMSVSYLQRCRYEGIGPRSHKIGRVYRYAVADLTEWITSGRAAKEKLAPPRRRAKGV